MSGRYERLSQLVLDIKSAFQEIEFDKRYGDLQSQQLQYATGRVMAALKETLDDITRSIDIESPIERMMLLRLMDIKRGGLYNRPMADMDITIQYPIGPYFADFSVSMNGVNVVIECDGHDFHEKTKEQAERDKKRDRYLTGKGYKVFRYSGSELYNGRINLEQDLLNVFYPIFFGDGSK